MVAETDLNGIKTEYDSKGLFWSMSNQNECWSILSTIDHSAYFVVGEGYFISKNGDAHFRSDTSFRCPTLEEALEVVMLWKLKQAGRVANDRI